MISHTRNRLSLLSLLLDSSGILRATQTATPFAPTTQDGTDPSGRGTTFKDVHGVEEAKAELYEIVEFLKAPGKFEVSSPSLVCRISIAIPQGPCKLADALLRNLVVASLAACCSLVRPLADSFRLCTMR